MGIDHTSTAVFIDNYVSKLISLPWVILIGAALQTILVGARYTSAEHDIHRDGCLVFIA